jgi:hypothetical protein
VGWANVETRVIGELAFTKSLDPDSDYCFTLQAESVYGLSARSSRVCTHTNPGNQTGSPIDPGVTFACGAPAACPAGFHPADYTYAPICPGDGLSDNRTVCAADTGTFTSCGSCPSGFTGYGGSFTESACTLPTTSRFSRLGALLGNASRCQPTLVAGGYGRVTFEPLAAQ